MFGLSNQVSCHHQRVGRGIRQNQTVSGTSHHINAHTAKQDPLGLGHELIAGTNKNIRFRQAKQTKRHRGNPLHPTERQNSVCTGDMRRIDNRRGNPHFGPWRRTGNDVFTACHFCSCDGHNRRGNMRIAAPGDIAACRPNRDTFLAGNQTRNYLIFYIGQSGFLSLCKAFDVVVRKANIGLEPFRNERTCRLNF